VSTYWYFECMEHDPPLRSDEEFTQHTNDASFERAVALAWMRPLVEDPEVFGSVAADYFERNAHAFLVKHPHCRVEMVSEYGVRQALEDHTWTLSGPVRVKTPEQIANDYIGTIPGMAPTDTAVNLRMDVDNLRAAIVSAIEADRKQRDAAIAEVLRMPDRHEAVPVEEPQRRHDYLRGYRAFRDEVRAILGGDPR
jgi:hypothetical protein